MNKEIKEIKHRLQLLHAECNPKAREEDINNVLDYITNLQQENERLKQHNRFLEDKIETYFDNVNMQNDLMIDQLDYKSRCEKAIEYIQDIKNITKHGIYPNYTYEVDTRELLNILQNGSEEK